MKTLLAVVTAVLCATAAQAATTLTLDPVGGAISGPAGSTVGWGFTFTNDTNYAVITGSDFCGSASVFPVCLPVTPDLGTYADVAGSQFLVIGPPPESPTLTQSFDGAGHGLGSFTFDPSASGTASGIIFVTYDLYTQSPNDPEFTGEQVGGGQFISASASVTVSTAPVPEPATLLLLGAGVAGFALKRVRRAV